MPGLGPGRYIRPGGDALTVAGSDAGGHIRGHRAMAFNRSNPAIPSVGAADLVSPKSCCYDLVKLFAKPIAGGVNMSRLLKPVIRGPVAAAEGEKDGLHDRVLKYIPLEIAGAFPMVMSAIEQRVTSDKPVLGLPPLYFAWIVFGVFLLVDLLLVHRGYKKTIPNPARDWIEIPHLLIHVVAFLIWTYDIRAVIWSGRFEYDPLVVLVVTALFAIFAIYYQPTISKEVAEESGLIAPSEEKPDAGAASAATPAPASEAAR